MLNPSSEVSLPVYVWGPLFALFAIFLVCWFIYRKRQATNQRNAFFDAFQEADLRLSTGKVGLVYQVIEQEADMVTVKAIWSDGRPVRSGNIRSVEASSLQPFDKDKFLF